MARLYITVYSALARDATNMPIPIPEVPPVAEDMVEITTDSRCSEPFGNKARFICVRAEAPCWLAFGPEPVAREAVHPLNAGVEGWYGVRPGDRVAVVEQL